MSSETLRPLLKSVNIFHVFNQIIEIMTKSTISSVNKSLVFDLQMAIKVKNLERVQSILKSEHAHLNSIRFIDKSTPLSYAIYIGFERCIQLLLDYGSDPNRQSTDRIGRGEPPLCTAIRIGDFKTVKLLLNCTAIDVHRTDLFGQCPTYLCVRYRRPEYLKMIVKSKCFDLKTISKQSAKLNALNLSAKYLNMGRVECFQTLINIGLKANQQIIDYVIQSGNQTALKMIDMCEGKGLSSCGQTVLTLKQLTRIVIRDIYLERSGRPVLTHLIEKAFPQLPQCLTQFLTHLSIT